MKGISIIIPVYNTALYIEECLKSIIKQGKCVVEIICVDDGSTDDSVKIIQRQQENDKRIKLICNKHCGVSRARNIGMIKAQAEYIMFVDSDDYLIPNTLNKVYQQANKKNADILVFSGRTENTFISPDWVRKAFSAKKKVFRNKRDLFCTRGILPSACNKLYKRSEFLNIKFPEELSIAEDNVFQFMAFINAKKIVSISRRVYVYRIHSESVIGKAEDEQKIKQHRLAVELVKGYLQKENLWEKNKKEFIVWTESFFNEEVKSKRGGKVGSFLYYINQYGLRSAIEYGIGKYILKEKIV